MHVPTRVDLIVYLHGNAREASHPHSSSPQPHTRGWTDERQALRIVLGKLSAQPISCVTSAASVSLTIPGPGCSSICAPYLLRVRS